jgi:hypothetical protein
MAYEVPPSRHRPEVFGTAAILSGYCVTFTIPTSPPACLLVTHNDRVAGGPRYVGGLGGSERVGHHGILRVVFAPWANAVGGRIMQNFFRVIAVICCAIASLQTRPAEAERRVALVIGNAGYRAVSELPNPRKDARDIAAALRVSAFSEVVERYDLGLREMLQTLAEFEDKVTGADWAVVYYAGHGIEVDGRNFLVPVDAELKRVTDVEDEALPLDRVLTRITAAGKLQLVILDACRFNPFKQRMAGAGTRLIGERGLARVEPAHSNIIVAYAARDGQAALDGKPGENSPYARALVKHLGEPGLGHLSASRLHAMESLLHPGKASHDMLLGEEMRDEEIDTVMNAGVIMPSGDRYSIFKVQNRGGFTCHISAPTLDSRSGW